MSSSAIAASPSSGISASRNGFGALLNVVESRETRCTSAWRAIDPVAALPGGVIVVRHRIVGAQCAERVVGEAVGEGGGIVEHDGDPAQKLYTCPEVCWDAAMDAEQLPGRRRDLARGARAGACEPGSTGPQPTRSTSTPAGPGSGSCSTAGGRASPGRRSTAAAAARRRRPRSSPGSRRASR